MIIEQPWPGFREEYAVLTLLSKTKPPTTPEDLEAVRTSAGTILDFLFHSLCMIVSLIIDCDTYVCVFFSSYVRFEVCVLVRTSDSTLMQSRNKKIAHCYIALKSHWTSHTLFPYVQESTFICLSKF